ncbi:MAG TPA: hypothetical protein VGY99_03475 [Candidatus Binataceae bacterium]|nr:hypothetical protein [Candidatus Binataceae bacterium]
MKLGEDMGLHIKAQALPRDEVIRWSEPAVIVAPGPVIILFFAAAVVYCFGLGRTLGASEAYSALAASQPTIQMVAQNAMSLDPGKPVLYHLVLHYFSACFGAGEASLRAMSIIFGLITVALV